MMNYRRSRVQGGTYFFTVVFERHVDYIHFNPVKHGYVSRALDWPYSSFHRYVREGVLPANWAVSEEALEGVGRE